MRPWKVNTVLSLDGFRVCISGGKGGGTQLITQTLTQFAASKDWAFYLKKLEEFNKKNSKIPIISMMKNMIKSPQKRIWSSTISILTSSKIQYSQSA